MIENTDWMKGALCTGHTHLFFPPPGTEQTRARYKREREAKLICNECPLLYQCRDYARRNDEMGIWGGETENERWSAGFMRSNIVMRRSRAASESRKRSKKRQSPVLEDVNG